MNIQLLPGPIGVQISDLDLSAPLGKRTVEEISNLAADRGVVTFRDQRLNMQQQVTFSAQFGALEQFPDQSQHGNTDRHIFRVSNQGDGYNVGHYWHMDGAPWPQPTALSTLLALDVPIDPATHTMFLSAKAAYQGLTEALKQRLDGLHWELATRVSVPLVRAHPLTSEPLLTLPFRFPVAFEDDETTRQALANLNRDIRPRVAGLNASEQDSLLLALVRHFSSQPNWQYKHAWRPGDLLLWDQRAVYHHATQSPQRRVLHRTAVVGERSKAYRMATGAAELA